MSVKIYLKKISVFILDVIFPIYCLDCGEEGEWICPACRAKIKLLEKQSCPICNSESKTGAICFNCRNKTDLDGVIAAANYTFKEGGSSLIKEAVHIFKYRFVKDLSLPLAELMIKQIKNRQLFKKEKPIIFGHDIAEDRIIIPVPLHAARLRWRGFNQAELLAHRLAERFDLPLDKSALSRAKNNIPQVEIKNRKERLENIQGAFECINLEGVKGRRVILIDDVCTTSGTMSECAKVLKKAGAKEVWGVVVARG